jgi:hypothetical protein
MYDMGMDEYAKKGVISGLLAKKSGFDCVGFIACLQGFSLGLRHKHWTTKNYALHKATEAIQETLDGLIDDFVEAYVGFMGGARPEFKSGIKASDNVAEVISCLKGMEVQDTSLLNIRDEMLQACYKLKYLETLS